MLSRLNANTISQFKMNWMNFSRPFLGCMSKGVDVRFFHDEFKITARGSMSSASDRKTFIMQERLSDYVEQGLMSSNSQVLSNFHWQFTLAAQESVLKAASQGKNGTINIICDEVTEARDRDLGTLNHEALYKARNSLFRSSGYPSKATYVACNSKQILSLMMQAKQNGAIGHERTLFDIFNHQGQLYAGLHFINTEKLPTNSIGQDVVLLWQEGALDLWTDETPTISASRFPDYPFEERLDVLLRLTPRVLDSNNVVAIEC